MFYKNVSIMDVKISSNFLLSEFMRSESAERAKIHDQEKVDWHVLLNLFHLVRSILQPLREVVGVVRITSGYRCAKLNSLVGGASSSQHLYGEASDFVCADLLQACSFIRKGNFDQLILYDSFIHVSLSFGHNRRQYIDKRSR